MFHCPQCGEDTPELHEGYCEDCCASNQNALDLHNAGFDRWNRLSAEQRVNEIREAARDGFRATPKGPTP
jgi:hypothetical protein